MLKPHTSNKIAAATLENEMSIWSDSFSQKKLKRIYEIIVELQDLREELSRLLETRCKLGRREVDHWERTAVDFGKESLHS